MESICEPVTVMIGESSCVASDPVPFFRCECGETEFLTKHSRTADITAARRLLLSVLEGSRRLNGENLRWLRSVFSISAKDLSEQLQFKPSTGSQWESRNTLFDMPTSQGIALLFIKLMIRKQFFSKEEMAPMISAVMLDAS